MINSKGFGEGRRGSLGCSRHHSIIMTVKSFFLHFSYNGVTDGGCASTQTQERRGGVHADPLPVSIGFTVAIMDNRATALLSMCSIILATLTGKMFQQ